MEEEECYVMRATRGPLSMFGMEMTNLPSLLNLNSSLLRTSCSMASYVGEGSSLLNRSIKRKRNEDDNKEKRCTKKQKRMNNFAINYSLLSAISSSLPRPVEKLLPSSLHTLDLTHNNLTNFPVSILDLPFLSNLFLDHNLLVELPAEITKLASLKVLQVNNNQLTSLPATICSLTSLKKLLLSHNNLTSLPPGFSALTSLNQLSLSHNKLASLTFEMGYLASLVALDVSHNKLHSLPAEIINIKSLVHLFFSGNPINEGCFLFLHGVPKLKDLCFRKFAEMKENNSPQLVVIKENFQRLKNLPNFPSTIGDYKDIFQQGKNCSNCGRVFFGLGFAVAFYQTKFNNNKMCTAKGTFCCFNCLPAELREKEQREGNSLLYGTLEL